MQSNGGITTARSARERADPDAALRPGRRHDRRRGARPLDRPAQPPLHRHGRHVVRPQPRRRRRADRLDRDRARGPPGADAARRHPHHRRRRRLARVARGRRAPRRPAERRGRPRPGVLRPRRHPADRDRREPLPRPARPELLPRRRAWRSTTSAAERALSTVAAEVGLDRHRARGGHARDHQRAHGRRDADDHRQAGNRSARVRARRLRRRRADARRLARGGARDRRGDRALEPGDLLGLGDAADRPAPRRRAELLPAARRARPERSPTRRSPRSRRRGPSCCSSARASRRPTGTSSGRPTCATSDRSTRSTCRWPARSRSTEIDASFHDAHRVRYGHSTPGAPVEFVNLRIAAMGRIGTTATPTCRPPTAADPLLGRRGGRLRRRRARHAGAPAPAPQRRRALRRAGRDRGGQLDHRRPARARGRARRARQHADHERSVDGTETVTRPRGASTRSRPRSSATRSSPARRT